MKKNNINSYSLWVLLLILSALMGSTRANAEYVLSDANLDFTQIDIVSHSGKNMSSQHNWQIQGIVNKERRILQGYGANQDSLMYQSCISLAEQFAILSALKPRSILRIQAMPDPGTRGMHIIQYCTLYVK